MRGARAHLRTTTESDLADHLTWHADPELTKWMPDRPHPQTLEQRKEWLKEAAEDRGLVHWEIAEGSAIAPRVAGSDLAEPRSAERHVGYCAVRLRWPPTAEGWGINSLFLAPGARGRGLGMDAARALHRYLVDYLDLKFGDVWLYRDDAARRLFVALGYVEYSHGHDVFYREGRWWDDWRGVLRGDDFRTRFPREIEYPEREAS